MREILFKAKRLDNGEWVQGSTIMQGKLGNESMFFILPDESYRASIPGQGGTYEIFSGSRYCRVDPETVCQYTGLTDKNGVKIFEGDKCVFHFEKDSDPYKVFWDAEDGRWSVKEESCGETDYLDWFFAENCTVTGNIHDNT